MSKTGFIRPNDRWLGLLSKATQAILMDSLYTLGDYNILLDL